MPHLALDTIDVDPGQPRHHIDAAKLSELAASMDTNGLAVPILVRPAGDRFVIVHGERRYRAATQLGWAEIPADVRDLDDEAAGWLQLIENIQRADLTPIEEAEAYAAKLCHMTQSELAKKVGKDRSYIAQKLRLLKLPAPLQHFLRTGGLTEGHMRLLMRLKKPWGNATREYDELEPFGQGNIAAFYVSIRPLDWIPILPFNERLRPAVECFVAWVNAERKVETWVVVAFWCASAAVQLELSVAHLDKLLQNIEDHVAAAVCWLPHRTTPTKGTSRPVHIEYYGYASDMRHAGVTDNYETSQWATNRVLYQNSWVLPSIMQPGAPNAEAGRALIERDA